MRIMHASFRCKCASINLEHMYKGQFLINYKTRIQCVLHQLAIRYLTCPGIDHIVEMQLISIEMSLRHTLKGMTMTYASINSFGSKTHCLNPLCRTKNIANLAKNGPQPVASSNVQCSLFLSLLHYVTKHCVLAILLHFLGQQRSWSKQYTATVCQTGNHNV